MGNRPVPMSLGSSLFGDLIEKVVLRVVSTANRTVKDTYTFTMATLDEAWRIVVAAWELVPEAQIRQGIR